MVGEGKREEQTPGGAGSWRWGLIPGSQDQHWAEGMPNRLSHPGGPTTQDSYFVFVSYFILIVSSLMFALFGLWVLQVDWCVMSLAPSHAPPSPTLTGYSDEACIRVSLDPASKWSRKIWAFHFSQCTATQVNDSKSLWMRRRVSLLYGLARCWRAFLMETSPYFGGFWIWNLAQL